ncbi:hypothetical protein AB0K00_54295 [Dactylosporangium sp. NPDC049525]
MAGTKAVAGQLGWYAASAPGSYSPWQMGVPLTDPQEWDWLG